jgi:rhodanese-related sulfurtransferase
MHSNTSTQTDRRTLTLRCVAAAIAIIAATGNSHAAAGVGITEAMPYVEVDHHGIPVRIERIQDTDNRLVDDFSKTSRPCPPFCIHPMSAAPGVTTIGELELLHFLQTDVAEHTGLLIDARMTTWYDSETIPGAVNIPFVIFTTTTDKRDRILELLGAKISASGELDFSDVLKLGLFCNGPWCDQSPRAIKALISAGYPADKLMYYRGGMQAWKMFGLTTVLPTSHAVEE